MDKQKLKNILIIAIAMLLICLCALGIVLINQNTKSNYENHLEHAMSYYNNADYDNAIVSYKEALNQNDEDERAYIGIANSYRMKSDYASAIAFLQKGIDKTDSAEMKKMLADFQHIMNSTGEGIYDLIQVVRDSENVTLSNNLLDIIARFNFADYTNKYKYEKDSTGKSYTFNDLQIICEFEKAPTSISKPVCIKVLDISKLFDNLKSGVSYERLSKLNLPKLTYGYNERMKCNAVEFENNTCQISIECDDKGNIIKFKPQAFITFSNSDNEKSNESSAVKNDNSRIFKGQVIDATTEQSAGKVHMKIYNGKQADKGQLYKEIDTDENGEFKLDIPYGDYSIELSAEEYITEVQEVTVRNSDDVTVKDFVISPKMDKADTIRIVLTWGNQPRDIDSHLYGTTSSGDDITSWYGNKTNYDKNDKVISTLDIDDMDGNGMETTTLYDTSGTYHFYVKNFSMEAPLKDSHAVVKVYMGNSDSPQVIEIPSNLNGNIWEVLKIENGKVTIINKASNEMTE